MKKIKLKSLYLIILISLFSCNKSIIDTWLINKILYDNQEIELNTNLLIFKKDLSCVVPQIYGQYNRTEGEWGFMDKNKIRIYNCEYPMFDGIYTFEIEKNSGLNLHLKSERVEIYCNQ